MSPPEPETAPAAASVFAALGDATRLALVSRLSDGGPRSITQLSDGLALTRQGVSKHLRVLEDAGIVRRRRVGRESRFLLQPAVIDDAREWLERASAQWDATLSRLRAIVEDG